MYNRDKYIKYLSSDKWKSIRRMMLVIYEHKCKNCKAEDNLEIHHLHYKNIFKEKYKDLVVLCRDCHERAHVARRLK